ncbi:MAG TPA: hypothetical protein VIN07_05230 [Flavipsychrobacter sp.]
MYLKITQINGFNYTGVPRVGIKPSALEFMERQPNLLAIEYPGNTSLTSTDDTGAHLLIELDRG